MIFTGKLDGGSKRYFNYSMYFMGVKIKVKYVHVLFLKTGSGV